MTSPPVRSRHFLAGTVRLHYIEFPNSHPPLVVIPGITMPAATWEFVGRNLAHFAHVYILDPRGRGLSQGGPHLGYRLLDYAQDVLAMQNVLHLPRTNILGHSMGARIAMAFAATYPESVGDLVLVDPPMTGPGRRPYPSTLASFLDVIDLVSKGRGYEEIASHTGWPAEQVEMRMKWLPTCDRHAVEESYRSFSEESIHALLPRIFARSLLVYAERGNTVTEDEAEEFVQLLPHAMQRRIANAGHMIPWDNMGEFVSTVRQFLTGPSVSSP